ncbi:MAG: OmpA family protein [Bacteroidetes bacterium]|nr:MAG: OmpA family protein [Bacteroidota bacterium]
MKTQFIALGLAIAALMVVQPVCSQENPTEKIKRESHKVINRNIDKLFGKKKKKETPPAEQPAQQEPAQQQGEVTGQEQQAGAQIQEAKPELKWSKYDFVPGDRVIFEDDLVGEENGEFPSRWDLVTGNVEVAEFGGENVIMFRDGTPAIVPYFKEAKEDYLPDVFTVEFDLYCSSSNFVLFLYDRKNQESRSPTGYTDLEINHYNMDFGRSSSDHPDKKNLAERRWMHVSVAYTNGKLKAYMDETRLINLPRIDFDPKGITLYTYHANNERLFYVKNVRIAEGGVKYYDRVMQDGKIVATGIRFDTGKSTLKPESMGVINEIYELMEKYPELKFSVEGHTDNVGDDASNMTLSADRAERVMNTLIEMGINGDRLTSKGLGESMPMDDNNVPEGRANNRRVEFVKF